ncbi:MAG TPA: 5'/3'-nucleotidase SurE [Anaerolineae bacterium]|nr:5'/3'-nucleotidase SurE [Anaerolineae bacterium]
MTQPLILITNDDGIASKGLRSAAEACDPLGEVLICAPTVQQSGTGRSMPPTSEGRIFAQDVTINGRTITGYAIEGTPAQVVQHGMFEIAERAVDLVVSGINYGENLGEGVSVSGTVGATMESGSFGVPSIAISLETDPEHYLGMGEHIDFSTAAYFLRFFAQRVLEQGLPPKTRVLKVEIPRNATSQTEWRWTRLSQVRYFTPIKPHRRRPDDPAPMGYETLKTFDHVERDSDVWAVRVDHVVSVTPLSLDFTAPIDLTALPR